MKSWRKENKLIMKVTYSMDKYKEAENTFEKLVIIDPKFSKAWESYSESLLLQNELDKSLEYIDKAISINSSIEFIGQSLNIFLRSFLHSSSVCLIHFKSLFIFIPSNL